MAEYEKKVRKELRDNGCSFVRHGKGDHDIWYSPITGQNFPVDTKIKSRHNGYETERNCSQILKAKRRSRISLRRFAFRFPTEKVSMYILIQ